MLLVVFCCDDPIGCKDDIIAQKGEEGNVAAVSVVLVARQRVRPRVSAGRDEQNSHGDLQVSPFQLFFPRCDMHLFVSKGAENQHTTRNIGSYMQMERPEESILLQ